MCIFVSSSLSKHFVCEDEYFSDNIVGQIEFKGRTEHHVATGNYIFLII